MRIPVSIIAEVAVLKTRAHAAWVEARAADDCAAFAPVLERMMTMQRQIAMAIGTGGHPYDAMLDMYEPGMTFARLQEIFDALKAAIVPLVERAVAPARQFPAARLSDTDTEGFGLKMAERMGYDLKRGRLG